LLDKQLLAKTNANDAASGLWTLLVPVSFSFNVISDDGRYDRLLHLHWRATFQLAAAAFRNPEQAALSVSSSAFTDAVLGKELIQRGALTRLFLMVIHARPRDW
jgi:hypothetical protein